MKQKEICSKILKYWVYCTTHQAAPKIDFSLWVPYDWLSLQNWSSHHPENREVSHKLDTASMSSVERVDEIEQGNWPAAPADKVVTMI